MKPIKILSLFSGYGSQELALKYATIPYEAVANSDINENANRVYDALHSTVHGNLGDITKIKEDELPECDLLTYSFPCQDISVAGSQKGIKVGTRSGLLYEVERLVLHNKPKYLLMENVKHLISKNHREHFNEWVRCLEGMGYANTWAVLNAVDFGCPQNRERVFMFSELGGDQELLDSKMSRVKNTKKERKTMRPFLEMDVDNSLFLDVKYEYRTPKRLDTVCQVIAKRTDVKYDIRKRIYSIDAGSPCLHTLPGMPQIMLDDKRIRVITAREGYRFMGIKEHDINLMLTVDISDTKHIALAGNSICVPVMEELFKEFFSEHYSYGRKIIKELEKHADALDKGIGLYDHAVLHQRDFDISIFKEEIEIITQTLKILGCEVEKNPGLSYYYNYLTTTLSDFTSHLSKMESSVVNDMSTFTVKI